jgi:hypothetical protein
MKTTNKEIKEKEERLLSFKKEVEKLHDNTDVEEYARQLAHLFLGNGLSLQTILLMAIDFGQQHPQWIPVEEELPEKDNEFEDYSKLVIVTNGKDFWKGMYNYGGEEWRTFDLWLIDDATHWMEIQPPRKEADNDKR